MRRRARQAGQARGHLGGDPDRAGKDAMQRLAGDAKLAGRLADGQAEARQDAVPQDPARMRSAWRCGFLRPSHELPLRHGLCVAILATGQAQDQDRSAGGGRRDGDRSGRVETREHRTCDRTQTPLRAALGAARTASIPRRASNGSLPADRRRFLGTKRKADVASRVGSSLAGDAQAGRCRRTRMAAGSISALRARPPASRGPGGPGCQSGPTGRERATGPVDHSAGWATKPASLSSVAAAAGRRPRNV